MSAMLMLANKKTAAVGEHPIVLQAAPFTMTLVESFDVAIAKGWGPPPGLVGKAKARPGSGHVRDGRWLLNRELMRIVAEAHGVVRWALGRKRHTTKCGKQAPCWYGYARDKLVAMAAPMDGG